MKRSTETAVSGPANMLARSTSRYVHNFASESVTFSCGTMIQIKMAPDQEPMLKISTVTRDWPACPVAHSVVHQCVLTQRLKGFRLGLSSDMRTLIASAEPRAQDAVDIFCCHQITTISTSMNGIDEQYSPAEQPQGSTKKLRKSDVTEPRTRPRFNDT